MDSAASCSGNPVRVTVIWMWVMKELDVDSICKALAHPVRRNILTWLREPARHFADQPLPFELGVCATTIDRRCGLAQSTVSAHLAALVRAGLLTSRKISQSVCFKRNEAALRAFADYMSAEL
jgi:DNA-binding transcriptional ArsR family regulator